MHSGNQSGSLTESFLYLRFQTLWKPIANPHPVQCMLEHAGPWSCFEMQDHAFCWSISLRVNKPQQVHVEPAMCSASLVFPDCRQCLQLCANYATTVGAHGHHSGAGVGFNTACHVAECCFADCPCCSCCCCPPWYTSSSHHKVHTSSLIPYLVLLAGRRHGA